MSLHKDVGTAYRRARKIVVFCAVHRPALLLRATRLVAALRRELARAKIRERYIRVSLKKEDQALAVLSAHPEWSNQQIAAAVRTNRRYLSSFKRFRAARAVLQAGRQRFKNGDVVQSP